MNRVGMMVDISHAGEKSFYDALEISTKPIVASHSSARALCDHPRNLTDAQLKALAAKGGVAQVTLYDGFLRKEGHATIKDAINHLNHMVNIMGIEHVGIGTDFDGDRRHHRLCFCIGTDKLHPSTIVRKIQTKKVSGLSGEETSCG